jgi:ribosomal protein S18 acetylase RimI-like enzyme
MFPAGFLTAWHAGRLAGYAQSCIWDEKIPKFSPAKNFFRNKHTAQGETLYIIFVGVSPEYQRQGIAGRLIHALREVARENGQKKVHAVTWDHMRKLYVKHGFKPVGKMPGFLPKGEFTMLEYRLEKDG